MDLLTQIFEVSAAVLVSLGDAAAIIFGFSSWLGKVWANRLMENERASHAKELEAMRNKFLQETESYKIKLKKSEFLFEKEFAAASELVSFVRGISPQRHWEEMDWHNACDLIAMDFEKNIVRLKEYVARHGAALDREVVNQLEKCIGIAEEGKFDVVEMEVGAKGNNAADHFYKELVVAEGTRKWGQA